MPNFLPPPPVILRKAPIPGLNAVLRRAADGSRLGDWFGCELASVFQPVVEADSGSAIGYEAFLRCHGGGERALSPWMLFSANATDERLIALDRLARTLHAANFVAAGGDAGLLFLNVHGRLLAAVANDHGAAFRRIVDALCLPPERIVIETPVVASGHADLLAFVLRNYRNNGFRVAVNILSEAQWRSLSGSVSADFVKIDASALDDGDAATDALDHLGECAGRARIIVKRVETLRRWPAGVLVQGFAYGAPAPGPKGAWCPGRP